MAAYARKITRSVRNLPLVAACPKPKSKLGVLAKKATKSVHRPRLIAALRKPTFKMGASAKRESQSVPMEVATTTTVTFQQMILLKAVLARRATKSVQVAEFSLLVTVLVNVLRRKANKKSCLAIRVLKIALVARKLNAFNKL